MTDQRIGLIAEHLVIGCVFALAGATAGIWLAPAAILFIGLVIVLRICWIEDNIHHDLLPNDRIPPGYRRCRIERRGVFGGGDPRDDTDCPRYLASQMRVQERAWSVFLWGLAAGGLATFGGVLGALSGLACLAMALRFADAFAAMQAVVLGGQSLGKADLAGHGALARLAHSSRRTD